MDATHRLLHARRWSPAGWWGQGPVRAVPGIANLHSHAFQRAMAGMAEHATGATGDSFWTWRETMYRFAARFTPETLHAVALQLYVEMLEAGYTSVCEFHYLHHAPDGTPYADRAAMSRALAEAAREAGIRLTLLPVLYMTGGFDGRALGERQARFGHTVEAYLSLLDALRPLQSDTLRVGCALHSLRAVPADAMRAVLAALPVATPVHIHIAEQTGEVDDCIALRGARPVQWLLDHAPVDAHWTLVHATHLADAEVRGIAASGATVALCPTTEANLGDGLFPLRAFLDAGGRMGIGSDSHVSVSPLEELRWLEYGQRLASRSRTVAVETGTPGVAATLLRAVVGSAPTATGFDEHAVSADAVVLDDVPALVGATDADALERWVFAGNRNAVRDVHVAGRCVVEDGAHRLRDAAFVGYRAAMEALLRD